MRIGYSYHGFCQHIANANVANTPDSQRLMRMQFVDQLIDQHDCTVLALQPQREEAGTLYRIQNMCGERPDIDALFLEWRWPTWKNTLASDRSGWWTPIDDLYHAEIEHDWAYQRELIQHYTIERNVPTFIHDLDYKLTYNDREKIGLQRKNVFILDPGLSPDGPGSRISVPNYSNYDPAFIAEFRKIFPPNPNPVLYGYIGNNYERDEQFEEYYGKPSKTLRKEGVQTVVYGNWINRSPERCDPGTTLIKYPHIAFPGRVGFSDAMHRLREFGCVTHIGKDEDFAQNHVITIRYHEAALCGVPAFIPACYRHADILGKQWVVSDSKDVLDRVRYVKGMSLKERLAAVDGQIESMAIKCKDVGTSVDVRDITSMIVEAVKTHQRQIKI